MAARGVHLVDHAPYSPNQDHTNSFISLRVKKKLAGLALNKETFMHEWGGGVRTLMGQIFSRRSSRSTAAEERVLGSVPAIIRKPVK